MQQRSKKALPAPGAGPGRPDARLLAAAGQPVKPLPSLAGALPALTSAANSPRKLGKAGSMPNAPGGHQLSAAERVRLRQQAAAMGVVERLKQRKAWGPGAAAERWVSAGALPWCCIARELLQLHRTAPPAITPQGQPPAPGASGRAPAGQQPRAAAPCRLQRGSGWGPVQQLAPQQQLPLPAPP